VATVPGGPKTAQWNVFAANNDINSVKQTKFSFRNSVPCVLLADGWLTDGVVSEAQWQFENLVAFLQFLFKTNYNYAGNDSLVID